MIQYWPNKQSIRLNNSIVDLFLSTQNKFIYNLSNKTNEYLYSDILNNIYKSKLFDIILDEFKELILDLIELNLDRTKLIKLSNDIINILVDKVFINFSLNVNQNIISEYKKNNFSTKYNILIKKLLIYLILGSSKIDNYLFSFDPIYTPYKHVQILFENFIIEISNLIIKILLNNMITLPEINTVFKHKYICNTFYLSNRSIIIFINNLKWQQILNLSISESKNIYNENYKVWLISSQGIISKKIHTSRTTDLKKIKIFQLIYLFSLEIKDIFIPRIEIFFIQIMKYTIYFAINLISNIIIIIIKIITFYLRK
uniref:Uncharacterized protein n=1 Tax=Sonderella linearis TaxID=110477 RepID=A0A1Z1MMH3_9FLOR|nr:hypothetical protein [Sonderella linearis]ARW66951.1 hypothetical protein [Sonderella linearis]